MEFVQDATMIFIDGQNIFCDALDNRLMIYYGKIRDYFENKYNVIRKLYYSAFDKNNEGQQKFFFKITNFGFILKIKPLKVNLVNGEEIK